MAEATLRKFWELFKTRTKICRSGCVEWTGHTSGSGYPEFRFQNTNHAAHRVCYEYFHGPIPAGFVVRHKCDNKRCVSPWHLLIGTHQQNMDDMRQRGRAAPGNRKLSERNVLDMRSARDSGMPIKAIAAMFGVSASTASKVCTGAAYAHIK